MRWRWWLTPSLVMMLPWALAACLASYAQEPSPALIPTTTGTHMSDLVVQGMLTVLVGLGGSGGLLGLVSYACRTILAGQPKGVVIRYETHELVLWETRPLPGAPAAEG